MLFPVELCPCTGGFLSPLGDLRAVAWFVPWKGTPTQRCYFLSSCARVPAVSCHPFGWASRWRLVRPLEGNSYTAVLFLAELCPSTGGFLPPLWVGSALALGSSPGRELLHSGAISCRAVPVYRRFLTTPLGDLRAGAWFVPWKGTPT